MGRGKAVTAVELHTESDAPNQTVGLTIIGTLALVQSALGLLRAFHWFDVGSDLLGQGVAILPIIGMIAYARGLLVAFIALLYVVFAVGAFTRKTWAPSLGVAVAVVNLLLVLSVLIQGESLARGLFWLIVPLVIVWYMLSAAGRQAFDS